MSLRELVIGELNKGIAEIVHQVFLSFFSRYSVQDLKEFIDKDIDPFDDLKTHLKNTRTSNFMFSLLRKYPSECLRYVNMERIMKELSEHRPDLHQAIRTAKGIAWVRQRVERLRQFIIDISIVS